MNQKLKFYADHENFLLDSVRGTILKAYEKSEDLMKEKKNEIGNFFNRIKNLEETLKNKEIELNSMKASYKKKIDELNDEIKIKSR